MERINKRNIRLVEFDSSTNWGDYLPSKNWVAIILTKTKNKKYFDEIIRKSIERNACFICSMGDQQDLVHEMADQEIAFRETDIEPLYLPEHKIITTGHDDLEEGIWFGTYSALNDEFDIEDVVIINATYDGFNEIKLKNVIEKFKKGYIPKK